MKTAASDRLSKLVGSLPRRLRSFDPSITDPATGNNALHELLDGPVANHTDSLIYRTVEALVQRGVDVNQRNQQGDTPALTQAASGGAPAFIAACCLPLLFAHGADINAQDRTGNTVVHRLIRDRAGSVLQRSVLLEGDVRGLDLFVLNHASQTVADLAAIMLAQHPNDDKCKQIHRMIQLQLQVWHSNTRPAVLDALSEPMIPDIAKLVLGYVDGSGKAAAA